MRSLLIGTFLSAIVLFVWGFLMWGGMLYSPLSSMNDQDSVSEAMTSSFPESGVYLVPNMPDNSNEAEVEDWTARYQAGPLAMVFYREEGATPMGSMLPGFIHMLLSSLLMAFLLQMVVSALSGYGQRVLFVAFVGLVGAFWINLANPIWWNQPWSYHIFSLFYSAVGWLLAGLAMAKFIKPEAEMATEIAE